MMPFMAARPPPGVVPHGATLAHDDVSLSWAAASTAFSEGQTFLGYSELALLAQRPEYRRISEIIATEMTRKWIKIQASGDSDKGDIVKRIEDAMKSLRVQEVFRKLAEQDGFFGRAHLYLDLGTTDDREELKTPIGDGSNQASKTKIGKGSIRRLTPVEAAWCYPTEYNSTNPLKQDWYTPSNWYVQGTQINASRLLTFVGREVPDLLKPAYSFGGLSLTQMAKPYVDNWLRTRQSVSDIVNAFSVFNLQTDLVEKLGMSGDGGDLVKRAELFNNLRNNRGLLITDKEMEGFANISAPISGLDVLQAQTLEHICSVSGIPLVKYTGISPSGLNASSEGELECFATWIHASQERLFRRHLTTLLGFIQISEFGAVDPDITFDFEPLDAMSEKETAEIRLIEAQTGQVLFDTGAISQEEERKRVANDPMTPYPGMDIEDLPEMPGMAGSQGSELQPPNGQLDRSDVSAGWPNP